MLHSPPPPPSRELKLPLPPAPPSLKTAEASSLSYSCSTDLFKGERDRKWAFRDRKTLHITRIVQPKPTKHTVTTTTTKRPGSSLSLEILPLQTMILTMQSAFFFLVHLMFLRFVCSAYGRAKLAKKLHFRPRMHTQCESETVSNTHLGQSCERKKRHSPPRLMTETVTRRQKSGNVMATVAIFPEVKCPIHSYDES